ncbi:hypothetical protein EVAR_10186_1 [Eumeta japonica]|uniref:Uncharacterized protein n=1 Tax=Eumeta variegata TaxID=151549 RepID=A0A4C1TDD0_EUMVA|nr:hypothetical protein EVAR_10186_1 [Eumeta japonica]
MRRDNPAAQRVPVHARTPSMRSRMRVIYLCTKSLPVPRHLDTFSVTVNICPCLDSNGNCDRSESESKTGRKAVSRTGPGAESKARSGPKLRTEMRLKIGVGMGTESKV